MFRRKLELTLLIQIYQAYLNTMPATLLEWKKAAVAAENHIRVGKRAFEDTETYPREAKKMHWNIGSPILITTTPRSPLRDRTNTNGYSSRTNRSITIERRAPFTDKEKE